MADKQSLNFDLFVVGGGPAGLTLAERAAQHGLSVGIADKAGLGHTTRQAGHPGLALSFSGGPQRLIHLVGQLADSRLDQNECGFAGGEEATPNWPKMVAKMAESVFEARHRTFQEVTAKGVRLFAAKARFLSAHKLELMLADGQKATVEAKKVVIAIGSSVAPLTIPGAKELTMLPDELFLMPAAPQKALVIGSSYQALELAGFLRTLKAQVTVIHAEEVEPTLDSEMVAKMLEFMATFYEINLVKASVDRLEKFGTHTVAVWKSEGGAELSDAFDVVFNCGARQVPISWLQLDKAGVALKDNGKIQVDEHFETNVKGIYAIGEASTEGTAYASLVSRQAAVLADGMLQNRWRTADPTKLPVAILTPIEYGFIGLGEEEAVGKFGADDVDVYYSTFKPLEWNFSEKRKKMSCFTKVVHHNKDDRVLGIHYLGPHAADIIQGFAVVVALGLPMAALQETVGIHPTTAEEVVNIKLNKRFDDPNANAESNC